MHRWFLGFCIATTAVACYLPEDHAPCPCAPGWVCCEGESVCVPSGDTCPGGVNDAAVLPDFKWQVIDSLAGEQQILGVDVDGAGGLWIAYYVEGTLRVVHMSRSRVKLAEFPYAQTGVRPVTGLAFTGSSIWLNYRVYGGYGSNLRKLDATTGAELATFATESSIEDIAYDGEDLLLSKANNQLLFMDPATGGIKSRVSVPTFFPTTQSGVTPAYPTSFVTTTTGIPAVRVPSDDIRVASWQSNRIIRVDRSGAFQRAGTTSLLPFTAAQPLYLANDGEALILATDNQISWLTPQTGE